VYERELQNMAKEFGELHLIPIILHNILGDILHALGALHESKALRMHIKDQIAKTDAYSHPFYLTAISDVIDSHRALGELAEARALQEFLLKIETEIFGKHNLKTENTLAGIAVTFRDQGQWKEAESLQRQVLDTNNTILGLKNPSTLAACARWGRHFGSRGS
jgi:hypothetical protein